MTADLLVSCLMVTLGSKARLPLFKRSVAAYCAQTHPNRELVIVLDEGAGEARAEIADHLAALGRDDIRVVEAPGRPAVGALRNLSREVARGQVHCQWDDDDLHHPDRLADQLGHLLSSGGLASCLQDMLQFFPARRTLYWTNWRAAPAKVMPGSLMCRAEAPVRYADAGEKAQLGEDTHVCLQFEALGGLRALADAPHLQVYLSHGDNSWHDGHHAMLADQLGVSSGLLRRREPQIRRWLAPLDLGPGPLTVRGPNGPAFTVEGAQGPSSRSTSIYSR